MADDEDVSALFRGNLDMARRDLRNGKFANLQLPNADFSGAHLEKANFDGANLSTGVFANANTNGMVARGADLSKIRAEGTVFFAVDLSNSDLRASRLSRSHFSRANLSGANLSGANFRNAVFNEGTTLEGCIIDTNTRFDGASVFRPLARQPAFRNYRVERGLLVRISESEIEVSEFDSNTDELRRQIRKHAITLSRSLDQLSATQQLLPSSPNDHPLPGIGHNLPPDAPLDVVESNNLRRALAQASDIADAQAPDPTLIEQTRTQLALAVGKVGRWLARKLDLAADEFAKQLGKAAAIAGVASLSIWYGVFGDLSQLDDALSALANLLPLK